MNSKKNLRLQQLAKIAYVGFYWNAIYKSDKIKELVAADGYFYIKRTNKFIYTLMSEFKEKLKEIHLPDVLYEQLVEAALLLGLQMINWYYYVAHHLHVPQEFTKLLYWTQNGTIDKSKIVETDWLKAFSSLNKSTKDFKLCLDLYNTVCSYALKDYVNGNWNEILNFCFSNFDEPGDGLEAVMCSRRAGAKEKKRNFIVTSVLIMSDCVQYSAEKRKKLLQKYAEYLHDGPEEPYMFFQCVNKGYAAGAQYYWNLLNPEKKEKQIIKAVKDCIREYNDQLFEYNHYIDPRADVLAFLLSQMSDDQMKKLVLKINDPEHSWSEEKLIDKILVQLIDTPSLGHFFIKLFCTIKTCLKMEKQWYNDTLKKIVRQLSNVAELGLDTVDNCYKKMFFVVWEEIEKLRSAETPLLIENAESFSETLYLYKLFDHLDVVNLIINFECREEVREKFLMAGEKYYQILMEENRYEALDEFMGKVLRSEEERKWFKDYLKFFDHFLFREQWETLDKLLDWQVNSDEERKSMKDGIDFMYACAKKFIQGKSDSVDKILNWRFSNEEEKLEYFKNTYQFDWLHKLCIDDVEDFLYNTQKFLNSLLGSKEEVQKFIAQRILNEKVLRRFIKNLTENYVRARNSHFCIQKTPFSLIESLINFCSLSEKNVSEFKLKIRENVSEWLLYLVNDRCAVVLDNFLDWIFGKLRYNGGKKQTVLNYEEKQDTVKKFLLSPDGVDFFKKITACDRLKIYGELITLWTKWAGGFDRVKNFIDELDGSVFQDLTITENVDEKVEHFCFHGIESEFYRRPDKTRCKRYYVNLKLCPDGN